jgi:capsular polysaccharide biosynthesis protein
VNYRELNFFQLLLIFRKRLPVILFFALLLGALGFLSSSYMMTPMYTATASMYVYSNTNRVEDQITSSELTASQELVNTYIVVLRSDTVLDQVIKKLSLAMTPEDIREILEAKSIDGTEAFTISVTSGSPQEAQLIVNTIADIAPGEIIRVVKAGGAEVIDYAKVPPRPSSPDIVLFTVAGAALGLILTFGICVAVVVFNTKIRGEEDLEAAFTIPVLGCIPTLAEK